MGWGRGSRSKRKEKGEAASLVDVEAKALSLLSRRDHGTEELRRKLRERYYPQEHIDTVIERFTELNYLDDARIIGRMARALARKGWGPMQLRAKLSERGFSGGDIDGALEELDEDVDWQEHALDRFYHKFSKDPGELDRDEQQKAWRYLSYRGFPGSVVREVLYGG